MKEKSKKILLISLCTLLLGVFCLNTFKVSADSGWDSSYDSSSSSSSSSSSDSSGGGHEATPVEIIIFVIIIILAIYFDIKQSKKIKVQEEYLKDTIIDVPIPGFNREEFLKLAYEIFLKVQDAWSEFKYDELQKLLTDELYNTYKSQLKALSLKKQKNIMSNFGLVFINIIRFSESEKEYSIDVSLRVKFYDYLINNNNWVVRGDNYHRLTNTYILTFVKSKSSKANKCPNCNALLDGVASNVCPYCGSTIVSDYHDFVLSKKQIVKQEKE